MNVCSLMRIGVPWLWYARYALSNQYTLLWRIDIPPYRQRMASNIEDNRSLWDNCIYAMKSKDLSSALGEHYQLHHPNDAAFVTFQILGTSGGSELCLRIMEGRIFKKLQPNLNRKKRTHGLGFLI